MNEETIIYAAIFGAAIWLFVAVGSGGPNGTDNGNGTTTFDWSDGSSATVPSGIQLTGSSDIGPIGRAAADIENFFGL